PGGDEILIAVAVQVGGADEARRRGGSLRYGAERAVAGARKDGQRADPSPQQEVRQRIAGELGNGDALDRLLPDVRHLAKRAAVVQKDGDRVLADQGQVDSAVAVEVGGDDLRRRRIEGEARSLDETGRKGTEDHHLAGRRGGG